MSLLNRDVPINLTCTQCGQGFAKTLRELEPQIECPGCGVVFLADGIGAELDTLVEQSLKTKPRLLSTNAVSAPRAQIGSVSSSTHSRTATSGARSMISSTWRAHLLNPVEPGVDARHRSPVSKSAEPPAKGLRLLDYQHALIVP